MVPGRLHAWQAVLQALLQQTPWAQWPVVHSLSAEQGWGGGLRPQLLIIPFMPQTLGLWHWAFVEQAPKQLVELHV